MLASPCGTAIICYTHELQNGSCVHNRHYANFGADFVRDNYFGRRDLHLGGTIPEIERQFCKKMLHRYPKIWIKMNNLFCSFLNVFFSNSKDFWFIQNQKIQLKENVELKDQQHVSHITSRVLYGQLHSLNKNRFQFLLQFIYFRMKWGKFWKKKLLDWRRWWSSKIGNRYKFNPC